MRRLLHRTALSDCPERENTCRVKPSDGTRRTGISEGEGRHRTPLASTTMHRFYTACRKVLYRPVQHWIKSQLVTLCRHRDNPPEPPNSCVSSPSGQGADTPGTQQLGGSLRFRVRAPVTQLMGLHGPHPRNTADRDRLPVLTPHAPSRKPKAIYRGPARGTNPPDSSGARGNSSSTPGRPAVVFQSASKPQVGGLTSDRSSAGQCPLVKAPSTAKPPEYRVGRFYGVGVAHPENEPPNKSPQGFKGEVR